MRFRTSPKNIIVVDQTVKVSKVYCSCTLRISDSSFPINLTLIPMREMNVTVGMDWLNQFESPIDCRQKIVTVRTPSGGELTTWGKDSKSSSATCYAARDKKYFQSSKTEIEVS